MLQWVLQIRDSSFFDKMSQIREILEFPYLPFLRSDAKYRGVGKTSSKMTSKVDEVFPTVVKFFQRW